MNQSASLRFESTAFAVAPGEDAETNLGVCGKALAGWIGEQLRAVGVAAGNAIPEDFGWCVPVKSPPYTLYVACANSEKTDHWQIFVFIEGGLIDRLLRKDKSTELLGGLYATVRRCIESSSIVGGLREKALGCSR